MRRAVAIDLGAGSGRIAVGELADGTISFQVVEQMPHEAIERNGRLEWDFDCLLGLCKRGVELAESGKAASVGIDAWGVDHGFLDKDGKLIGAPVCYRDLSHLKAFEQMKPHRERLYELTGIQHQPFNTVCQLAARKAEDPTLPERAKDWMILPDLLGYLLSGERFHETTEASTSQLMGLDGQWAGEAFQIAGWTTPERQPRLPGTLGGSVAEGVGLAHVGSHDTASAVAGFGSLGDDEIFLNVGTWSLAGCVIDRPIATKEAETAMFTNEWTVDGRVRFLKNIPGFYFINRLHKELGIAEPVPVWLEQRRQTDAMVDLFHPDFFNPESMVQTCKSLSHKTPQDHAEWAGLALESLVEAVARSAKQLETLTGRTFKGFRVGGGGSQSEDFCQELADRSGLQVAAGPAEATVLGNLTAQFLAQGAFENWADAFACVDRSQAITAFEPGRKMD